MESGHGSGSSKHSQTTPKATAGEDNHKLSKKSSSSSSSDSSFDEDFFLLDETAQPRKSSVSPADLLQLDENGLLVSDVGSLGPPTSSPDLSAPKQSPQIQVMERTEEPDHYRIPSTVFARTQSTAPVEWSVASNESLFSIHMGGHNSFSRDQAILMTKSQELGRPDDMFKFPNSTSVEVQNNSSGTTTPKSNSSELGVTEAAAETMKEVLKANAEDLNQEKKSAEAVANASPRSSGSGGSVVSFAFPILTKEGTKNASVKMQPESVSKKKKVEPEPEQQEQQQQSQPQTPITPPNAAATKWFPCLSCSFCR